MDQLTSEIEFDKSVYVVTEAGKPVFHWNGSGDEVRLSSLLKAVLSFCEAMGDSVKCIKSGQSRIVFLVRGYLSYVMISRTCF